MDSKNIYEALRKKIIMLELAPESVLNISELAEEFGVSRTPVKEALLTLKGEEWIVRQGSHFIVTPLSLERIREITEIRMVLETQTNVWALQRITQSELDSLKKLLEKTKSFDEQTPNEQIVELDFQIHHQIFKASKNSQLATLLERLLSHYLRFWLSIPRHINIKTFFIEAFDLVKAIEDRDEAGLRQCTIQHIRNSVAEIMGTR